MRGTSNDAAVVMVNGQVPSDSFKIQNYVRCKKKIRFKNITIPKTHHDTRRMTHLEFSVYINSRKKMEKKIGNHQSTMVVSFQI
jgi:hypothetical protein